MMQYHFQGQVLFTLFSGNPFANVHYVFEFHLFYAYLFCFMYTYQNLFLLHGAENTCYAWLLKSVEFYGLWTWYPFNRVILKWFENNGVHWLAKAPWDLIWRKCMMGTNTWRTDCGIEGQYVIFYIVQGQKEKSLKFEGWNSHLCLISRIRGVFQPRFFLSAATMEWL